MTKNLGYLTACPTNLGTGLRASVMIHLPALAINNELDSVFNAVTQVGMTIRGLIWRRALNLKVHYFKFLIN